MDGHNNSDEMRQVLGGGPKNGPPGRLRLAQSYDKQHPPARAFAAGMYPVAPDSPQDMASPVRGARNAAWGSPKADKMKLPPLEVRASMCHATCDMHHACNSTQRANAHAARPQHSTVYACVQITPFQVSAPRACTWCALLCPATCRICLTASSKTNKLTPAKQDISTKKSKFTRFLPHVPAARADAGCLPRWQRSPP